MEDGSVYGSSDEEYYDDEESLDGFTQVEVESDGVYQKPPSCKVIRKESLLAAQKEDLQYARSLLIHYRWDAHKAFDVLVERGRDKLYAEAGVTLEEKDDHCSTLSTTEMTCQICFEDVTCFGVCCPDI